MMDEAVGHMTEKVVIPEAKEIDVEQRRLPEGPKEDYLPYRAGENMVPPMAPLGEGYRFHVTGLTHDERGYPAMDAVAQAELVGRLVDKIRLQADDICRVEEHNVEDAEVIIVAYGITSRVVLRTLQMARDKGLKVGVFRPVVVWPFPEGRLRQLASQVKAFVVPELNLGQISLEVERIAAGRARTVPVHHAGGALHDPREILRVVKELLG